MDHDDLMRWIASRDPEADFAEAARDAEQLAPILVGLDEAQAKERTEARGVGFRVVSRDGVSFPMRSDRRPNRVNVAVEHGHVVSARVY